MRRNPDYQQDYAWFIKTWNTLEQRYGRTPRCDYQHWKQDPLAWRCSTASCNDDDASITEGENLQIGC